MTPAEIALAIFAACNSLRIFAYFPQILCIARDRAGAAAVSCCTWALFAISNFSTAAYGLVVVEDLALAAVFGANTVCCALIVGLTVYQRAQLRRRVAEAAGRVPAKPLLAPTPRSRERNEAASLRAGRGR